MRRIPLLLIVFLAAATLLPSALTGASPTGAVGSLAPWHSKKEAAPQAKQVNDVGDEMEVILRDWRYTATSSSGTGGVIKYR